MQKHLILYIWPSHNQNRIETRIRRNKWKWEDTTGWPQYVWGEKQCHVAILVGHTGILNIDAHSLEVRKKSFDPDRPLVNTTLYCYYLMPRLGRDCTSLSWCEVNSELMHQLQWPSASTSHIQLHRTPKKMHVQCFLTTPMYEQRYWPNLNSQSWTSA